MHDQSLLYVVVVRLNLNVAFPRKFKRVFHNVDENLLETNLITLQTWQLKRILAFLSLAIPSLAVDFQQGLSALALNTRRTQVAIDLVIENYLLCADLMREQLNDFLESPIRVEVA